MRGFGPWRWVDVYLSVSPLIPLPSCLFSQNFGSSYRSHRSLIISKYPSFSGSLILFFIHPVYIIYQVKVENWGMTKHFLAYKKRKTLARFSCFSLCSSNFSIVALRERSLICEPQKARYCVSQRQAFGTWVEAVPCGTGLALNDFFMHPNPAWKKQELLSYRDNPNCH